MNKNPFYGMSAAAMLFGCYMLNHALRLEPGHVGKLLTLMGVLQIYEALLLGLGTHLVVTRRAPRDGLTVLILGTLFLLDATLLATECVTADAGVGTVVSLVLVGLAAAKVAYVRRVLPDALPAPAAVLLGVQAALVFLLPVAVSQLASARLVTPSCDASHTARMGYTHDELSVQRRHIPCTSPPRRLQIKRRSSLTGVVCHE